MRFLGGWFRMLRVGLLGPGTVPGVCWILAAMMAGRVVTRAA